MDKKKKLKKVLAIIGIIILAGLVIATFICAIVGVPKNVLLALFVSMMIVPILMWVLMWFSKLVYKDNDKDENSSV